MNTIKTEEQKKDLMNLMLKAGVHFGHQKSKWHPKMLEYIFGVRNNVHLIDLEKTIVQLEEAAAFAKDIVDKGGKILFLGSKKQIVEAVEQAAKDINMPYVINRWIGGTFTNSKVISSRVKHLLDLENKKSTGDLKKYTKKEQLLFDKEIEKLNAMFGGIKEMKKLPEALFVIDAKEEKSAIAEAKRMNIAIIGICDTNFNPEDLNYAIPANDDAMSSVKLILDEFVGAIKSKKLAKDEEK